MEPTCFLDTNFLVRFLAADHAVHTPIARHLIEEVENGRLAVDISDTVIFETVFTMTSRYGADRIGLANSLGNILSLEGIRLSSKRDLLKAMELWTQYRRLSFADAYHQVLASNCSHKRIATFDKGMGNVLPDVSQIDKLS